MKLRIVSGVFLLGCAAFFPTTAPAQIFSKKGAQPESADYIIYNAKVLTVDSNFTVAQAIAVVDGRIEAVGRDHQVEEYRGPLTRMIDAGGRTVMPGLYDASVHSYEAAVSELKGPLPVIDSIEAAQEYIREQASNTPAGGWIVLDRMFPTRLKEGRLPTKAELDAATTNVPVYWNFGSVAIVNSKALEVSKITKDTLVPHGAEVEKDPRHLKPTGLLRNASSLLKLPPSARPATGVQEREALKQMYQLYNEQGITSIVEKQATPSVIDLFRDLSRSNELTLRINCSPIFQPGTDLDETIDRLAAMTNVAPGKQAYGPTGVGDDWVRIGALETILDGNPNIGTAYLRTPYGIGPTYKNEEPAYRGEIKQDSYILPQVYMEAAQRGWQVAAHCSGDAALDFALNSFEKVQFNLNIRDRRFLLTHSDFQAAQDWERAKKLGVGVVLEPGGIYEDGSVLLDTLGTNRLKYFVPIKGWLDRGIIAGGGSDHLAGLDSLDAVNPWNPWLAIWTTLTRETKQGVAINPEESISREQAVRLYTINNAWLNFEEKDKGSLEPGKFADLILVDEDVMKCPVSEIRNTKVLLTMVNGKVVWEAKQPATEMIPTAITVNVTNVTTPVAAARNDVQSAATNSDGSIASTPSASSAVANANAKLNPYAPISVSAPTQTVIANEAAAAAKADDSASTVAITNQPTVITVSNQTTSVTVTIQPTAGGTATENPSVAATNAATSSAATNQVPLSAAPVEASPAVIASPAIDATAQPAASATQTNQPSAAANTDAKTTSTEPAKPAGGIDWSHLFSSDNK